MANLLNIGEWTEGSGSVGNYSMNGSTAENYRFYGQDPWGQPTLLWQSQCDGLLGDGEGGWVANPGTGLIDNTKKYRFSVWVNRVAIGTSGTFYFGSYGYFGGANSGLIRILGGALDTNPYFYSSSQPPTEAQLPTNTWTLWIGHIYPYDHTGSTMSADAGCWLMDGTKLHGISREFRWNAPMNSTRHRVYMYYCNRSTDAIQQHVYPRIDLCDGNEPTVQQLIRNQRFYTAMNFGGYTLNIECRDVVSN